MTPITHLLKNRLQSGSGAYGSYYQLSSGRGLKMFDGIETRFATKDEAKVSRIYTDGLKEKRFLNLLTEKGCDFTPKCYGLVIFKYCNEYRIGLILQHLGEKRMVDVKHEYRNDRGISMENRADRISDMLYKRLEKKGIRHSDIHSRNIMYFQKRFWVIDFSPSMVEEFDIESGKIKKPVTFTQP